MNRSLKNLTLLLLLLMSSNLLAQLHYTVVPGNENQVTADIVHDFGHLMDISPVQLNAHVASLVDQSTYCATCPGTELSIQSSGQNTLQLHWPAVTNASQYEIRFLNLEDGNTGIFFETSNSITLNNLPNAAYAFSIGVNSTDGNNNQQASQRDIVILETPVVLVPTGYAYNCDCIEGLPKSLPIVASTISWLPELYERYKFTLLFDDGTNAEVILYATDSTDPEFPLAFSLDCAKFLYHSDGSNTLLSEGEASDFSLHFNYEEETYSIECFSESNPLISATLTTCQKDLPTSKLASEATDTNQFSIYPNPAHDGLWISSQSNIDDHSTVSLFNELGQKVKSEKLFDTNQFISIHELAAGRYTLQVKSQHKTATMSFIKSN